jgi:hypothetical protein
MVAEKQKKQGGAPPMPGGGMGGMGGMDLPPARIQPKCDRLRASMRAGGEQF